MSVSDADVRAMREIAARAPNRLGQVPKYEHVVLLCDEVLASRAAAQASAEAAAVPPKGKP